MAQDRRSCFVIMPFADPIGSYYASIVKPTVEAARLICIRADEITSPGTVLNQIWNEIQSAALCIADFTGLNPNVMYETGLAHAIGTPTVIYTQEINSLPFDFRHLRCIEYETHAVDWGSSLRSRLKASIEAVLEEPEGALVFNPIETARLVQVEPGSARQVRVTLENGLAHIASSTVETLNISAGNIGPRAVSFKGCSLVIPGPNQIALLRSINGVSFPQRIEDGESCEVISYKSDIKSELLRTGYSGDIIVRARFWDALGDRFLSEAKMLNVESMRVTTVR